MLKALNDLVSSLSMVEGILSKYHDGLCTWCPPVTFCNADRVNKRAAKRQGNIPICHACYFCSRRQVPGEEAEGNLKFSRPRFSTPPPPPSPSGEALAGPGSGSSAGSRRLYSPL